MSNPTFTSEIQNVSSNTYINDVLFNKVTNDLLDNTKYLKEKTDKQISSNNNGNINGKLQAKEFYIFEKTCNIDNNKYFLLCDITNNAYTEYSPVILDIVSQEFNGTITIQFIPGSTSDSSITDPLKCIKIFASDNSEGKFKNLYLYPSSKTLYRLYLKTNATYNAFFVKVTDMKVAPNANITYHGVINSDINTNSCAKPSLANVNGTTPFFFQDTKPTNVDKYVWWKSTGKIQL